MGLSGKRRRSLSGNGKIVATMSSAAYGQLKICREPQGSSVRRWRVTLVRRRINPNRHKAIAFRFGAGRRLCRATSVLPPGFS